MKIKRFTWFLFFTFSVLSILIWSRYSYPQLSFGNFSINRPKAVRIASEYLKALGIDSSSYKKAITFKQDGSADRYLQKTIGFDAFKKFLKEEDFDLFFWSVRFFKELEKEEFKITISSSTGEIISFFHTIDENAYRRKNTKEEAKQKAVDFLKHRFHFNPDLYILKIDNQFVRDNRIDYSFVWEKKDVQIPWSKEKDTGTGKMFISITVSGDDILSFSKNIFSVPDQFNRHLDKKQEVGENIITIIQIAYSLLYVASVFIIFLRRNHLAMHRTKKLYILIAIFFFILSFISIFNYFENVLYGYNTTRPFDAYLTRYFINNIISMIFAAVFFIIPGLSGELTRFEVFPQKKELSFLFYRQSSFLTRRVAELIILGYCVGIIMLGLQSLLIKIGQSFLGVWVENSWLGRLSTTYFPFITALTIGFKASLTEEISFRLFSISWFKKIFKNTFIAVVLSALLWGFAHSSYPIFPMWFRGIEVTCLGLFLSWIYLSFGIIPVIVAHYLFDAFWGVSGYLLGVAHPFDYYSSWGVLLLPAFLGLLAYLYNRREDVLPLKWQLNQHQQYNVNILLSFLKNNRELFSNKAKEDIRKGIFSHGWDLAVIDVALEEFFKENNISEKISPPTGL
ncbi:MAG TPA: CPBP family intramembrane metalloprotease [Candidatus Omnitrophota bacterium]|nr:CPBP family intramembrane metalloprotease [Candidatus Omnitrophota bacterium]